MNAGHTVRTTVRSLKKEESIRAMLRRCRGRPPDRLQSRRPLPMPGTVRNATSAKAQRLLGWKPRPREDAIRRDRGEPLKFAIV